MSKIDQVKDGNTLYDIKDRYKWSGTKAEWEALDKNTLPQDEEVIINITDDTSESPSGSTGIWISQAEYDALSDDEKNSDTTYYIYDADTNPNAAAIPFTSANYTATNVGDALEEIKADVGYKLRVLTQEEYDALETVDPNTIYFIS